MAMIARVKPIFRRRSGVRKTRAMALNKRMPPEGMPTQQGAAGEQVDERQQSLRARRLLQTGLHVGEVDERSRDVGAEAIQGDDRQSECDLPPKVGSAEDPRDGAEQEDASRRDAGRTATCRRPG